MKQVDYGSLAVFVPEDWSHGQVVLVGPRAAGSTGTLVITHEPVASGTSLAAYVSAQRKKLVAAFPGAQVLAEESLEAGAHEALMLTFAMPLQGNQFAQLHAMLLVDEVAYSLVFADLLANRDGLHAFALQSLSELRVRGGAAGPQDDFG